MMRRCFPLQVSIYQQGQPCGTLNSQQRGLYTEFYAQVDTEDVAKVHAVFECGETALGIPAPECGKMCLRISVPTSRLPRGKLLRGELVPRDAQWSRYPGGKVGELVLPPGYRKGSRYRFSWKPGDRIPCEALMCFFTWDKSGYLELCLDEQGNPQV